MRDEPLDGVPMLVRKSGGLVGVQGGGEGRGALGNTGQTPPECFLEQDEVGGSQGEGASPRSALVFGKPEPT